MALDPSSSSSNCSLLMICEAAGIYRPALLEEVLGAAQALLLGRVRECDVLDSPQVVRDFLRVRLGGLEHEVFAALMLDVQHRLIEYVELFRGTVTQAAVYPREVVKEALARNTVDIVLVHNHPSGVAEPSRSDEYLTQTLKRALALVDVRVVDHLVVCRAGIVSFAERGLL